MPKKDPNSFAKHSAKYLREALKKAARTYKPGPKPRPAVLSALRKKRDSVNAQIRAEKGRGGRKVR